MSSSYRFKIGGVMRQAIVAQGFSPLLSQYASSGARCGRRIRPLRTGGFPRDHRVLLSSSSSTSTKPLNAKASAPSLAKRSHRRGELPHSPSPPFPDEYESVRIVTERVPGPESVRLAREMETIQQTGTLHFFVDYASSRGNYLVDVDGNRYLDVLGQIASLPLGYNHPAIIAAMTDPANVPMLVQRPSLGLLPPADWVDTVKSTLLRFAPPGGKLTDAHTMMCGSCSNENALKAAFIWYRTKQRGGEPPTTEEMESCMTNSPPGSPRLSVLSFRGGFHGRLMGCMSATHSRALHKVDVPAFADWPAVDFPRLRYPLGEYADENAREEERCLALTEEAIVERRRAGCPVAAIIVEPILAEGGDRHASPAFFRRLRSIASEHGAAFIVDEVQTGGGGTGTFWAHERWGLDDDDQSPDIVTFSKKMQTGGYYAKPEFRPREGYRIFNTWMGDPSKMVQLRAFLDTLEEHHLLENTVVTGEYLLGGLVDLQEVYPHVLSNARGVGTFCAIDFASSRQRDRMVSLLRGNGVECGGSGDVSIRFRPALIFQPRHAAELLDIFEHSCGQL